MGMTEPLVLTHVTLLAADEAGTSHTDQVVVIGADGRIAAVGAASQVTPPSGYRVIDGQGKIVMPGLINAHAHLFSDGRPLAKIYLQPSTKHVLTTFMRSPAGQILMRRRARANALTQLQSGVTTIRTVGDVATEVIRVRDAIGRGELVGPTLIPSGPLMAIENGHGAPQIARLAEHPDQGRAATRRNLTEGARAIKVSATGGVTDAKGIGHAGTPEMDVETMTAICEEAHQDGVLVAAHAQSTEGVRRALRAGVDTIEHGSRLDDETIGLFLDNPRSLRGWSALIPTLQACMPLVKLDQQLTGIDDVVRANAEMVFAEMLAGISAAREHGIVLGMGTDSGVTYVTHANTWRELDLMVRYGGLTPGEAIHAATRTNARILGLEDEIGAVEAGRRADLLVLDEDPLNGMRALRTPAMVFTRGRLLERSTIKRLAAIDEHLDSF